MVEVTATEPGVGGVEIGNFRTASISGQKFHDLDGDRTKDPGEPGLGDWRIFIDRNGNGQLDLDEPENLFTDPDGTYAFHDLLPGAYKVREVPQFGWVQMTPNPPDLVVSASGQVFSGIDFGNLLGAAEIRGTKFHDVNGDGNRQLDEPGLEGWTIFLDAYNVDDPNGNGVLEPGEPFAVTDAAGDFNFTNLIPGTYLVREQQQPGWIQTTPHPAPQTIDNGQVAGGVLFGNFQLATITGLKFHDHNGNGVQDGSEGGLGGITIFLDTLPNGVFDTGEPAAVTNEDGRYSFTVTAGSYQVLESLPPGWLPTTPMPEPISITNSGQTATADTIGNYRLGTISGVKFNDLDGDGIRQSGEPGLEDWTIFLDANDDGALGPGETSTTTNLYGSYSFGSLAAGTYLVREVQQEGWTQTSANVVTVVLPSQSASPLSSTWATSAWVRLSTV